MSPTLSFLLGFACAGLVSFGLALGYYLRARKRVRSIKAAILEYQRASRTVGEATAAIFPKPNPNQ